MTKTFAKRMTAVPPSPSRTSVKSRRPRSSGESRVGSGTGARGEREPGEGIVDAHLAELARERDVDEAIELHALRLVRRFAQVETIVGPARHSAPVDEARVAYVVEDAAIARVDREVAGVEP